MLSQSGAVVSLLFLRVVASEPDFTYRGDLDVENLEKGAFSKFYIKGDTAFVPIKFPNETDVSNYFPKCCPPEYAYDITNHNCFKNNGADLDFYKNANLLKTGLDCEVIVDHVAYPGYFKFNDETKSAILDGKTISFGDYCIDLLGAANSTKRYKITYIVRECRELDYCKSFENGMCIKKCCPDGEQYIDRKCQRNPTFGVDLNPYKNIIEDFKGSFAVYHKKITCRKYVITNTTGLAITQDGSLLVEKNTFTYIHPIDEEKYCIEGNMNEEGNSFPVMLMCVKDDDTGYFEIMRVLLLISCLCLLTTVAVFIYISKTKTLMGKIVTAFSSTLFGAFLALSIVQFHPSMDMFCKPFGYAIFFLFTATFAWMNVMCYEIWKTLGMMNVGVPSNKQNTVFLKYNVYAWSIPTLLSIFIWILNSFRVLPDEMHPFLGETHCILENRISQNMYGHTIFAVFPQAVMLSINLFCFISTIRYFWKTKKEAMQQEVAQTPQIKRRKSKMQKYDLQRFIMAMKLFLVMGLSWVFEVISAVINFKQHPVLAVVERIFDTFNCLQGVLIFLIFIINRTTLKRLLRRFKRKEERNVENERVSSMTSNSCKTADGQEMEHWGT